MAQAIQRFVPDGASVAMGTALEPLIRQLIGIVKRDMEAALAWYVAGSGCTAPDGS